MQLPHNASGLHASQVDAPLRTTLVGSIRAKLTESFPKMPFALRRWCVILGSLREHMRIQFSIQSVPLGPGFELLETGWQENKRTTARAEGIRKLQAIRQTIDTADIQMFLVGFDAGEEYASGLVGSQEHNIRDAQHTQQKPLDS